LAGDVVQNSIKNTIEGPKKKIKVEKTIKLKKKDKSK
jgi:hypothetical protein